MPLSRKKEILDAVITIFQTKGIQSDFTMSELARNLDIGKSTIYEYFTTKDEILSEAVLQVITTAVDSITDRTIQSTDSFEIAFKKEIKHLLEMAKSSSYVFDFLTPEFRAKFSGAVHESIADRMRATAMQYQEMFIHIIQKGIKEDILHPTNLEINGNVFAAMISGSITRMGNNEVKETKTMDLDQYVDEMYRVTLHIFN